MMDVPYDLAFELSEIGYRDTLDRPWKFLVPPDFTRRIQARCFCVGTGTVADLKVYTTINLRRCTVFTAPFKDYRCYFGQCAVCHTMYWAYEDVKDKEK
jgi:hypothetical protein